MLKAKQKFNKISGSLALKQLELALKKITIAATLSAFFVPSYASNSEPPQEGLVPDAELEKSLEHYEQSVEQMETQYGPYHGALSQELTSLGQHHRQQGNLEESRDALQRAMHISRVNSGLYSLEQAAIIDQLVKTNTDRHDWESVNANQHYLFWLHQRNYEADDPRMLPILSKLGHWHLNTYDSHAHNRQVEHLLRAHNYYQQAINIVALEHGEMSPQLIDHLQGFTATNYFLAANQVVIYQEADDLGTSRTSNITNEEKRRLQQYVQNSFRSGRKSIDQAIRIHRNNDQSSLRDRISAEMAMADWNLLFDRWHTAMALYKEIHKSLSQELPEQEKADSFFAEPVPLPQLPGLQETTSPSTDQPYVVVAFDVTARGTARNIEFIEEFPERHTQSRIQVRRTLKTSKFRPRMENGEPVVTRRYTRKFVFPGASK